MAEYDWVLGIGIPIMFSLIFFFLDDRSSGLVIFTFLNIGLGIMVYAGLVEFWVLILSLIFTIVLIFLNIKGGSEVA